MSEDTQQNVLNNKILKIVSKVASIIIIAVTVFMMVFTVFSVLTFDRNDRNIFGIRFYIVQTGSMSLSENNKDHDVHFDPGDIVLIKNVKEDEPLKKGDIIAFISQNSSSFGETVTHMIHDVSYTKSGSIEGYATFGTNTGAIDEALVEPEYVIGEYTGKLPKVGYFFNFLRTTPGYIICILVPFLILILQQGINTVRLFKRYKSEQMAEMKEERERIAEERKQSAEMMLELQALREQLAKQQSEVAAAAAPDEPSDTAPAEDEPTPDSEPTEADTDEEKDS